MTVCQKGGFLFYKMKMLDLSKHTKKRFLFEVIFWYNLSRLMKYNFFHKEISGIFTMGTGGRFSFEREIVHLLKNLVLLNNAKRTANSFIIFLPHNYRYKERRKIKRRIK